MPDPSNRALGEFAGETARVLSAHGERLATVENDLAHVTSDREKCGANHTKALEELAHRMNTLTTAVDGHLREHELQRIKLDRSTQVWLAVLAGLITLGTPVLSVIAAHFWAVAK